MTESEGRELGRIPCPPFPFPARASPDAVPQSRDPPPGPDPQRPRQRQNRRADGAHSPCGRCLQHSPISRSAGSGQGEGSWQGVREQPFSTPQMLQPRCVDAQTKSLFTKLDRSLLDVTSSLGYRSLAMVRVFERGFDAQMFVKRSCAGSGGRDGCGAGQFCIRAVHCGTG